MRSSGLERSIYINRKYDALLVAPPHHLLHRFIVVYPQKTEDIYVLN